MKYFSLSVEDENEDGDDVDDELNPPFVICHPISVLCRLKSFICYLKPETWNVNDP